MSIRRIDIVDRRMLGFTLGPEGVVHGEKAQTIVDLSTTGPTAAEISAQALTFGKQMMDAPVSGGLGGAAKGTLAVMVSGPIVGEEES